MKIKKNCKTKILEILIPITCEHGVIFSLKKRKKNLSYECDSVHSFFHTMIKSISKSCECFVISHIDTNDQTQI